MTLFLNPLFLSSILFSSIINGDHKQAIATRKQKLNDQHLDYKFSRSNPLNFLTKAPKSVEKIKVLEQALKVANSLKDKKAKCKLLINIAEKYTELGKKKKAIQILENTLEIVKSFENLEEKTQLMLETSQAYQKLGKVKVANTILEETLTLVNSLEDELIKAQRLTEIALRQPEKSAQTLLIESQKLIAESYKVTPLFPSVENSVDSRILSISELSWPLFENWSLTGRLQYTYLGIPPENKPTSEINFSTGLTYEF
jgi:tetratricopeptide (TPR) repeat protein